MVASRDRGARHRRRGVRPRGRAGRADRHRRARAAHLTLRRGRAQGLPVRVRLPGPSRHRRSAGRSVHATRVEIGRRLAVEAPVEADLVIPVPESGTPAAVGYAEASPASRTARAWSRTPTSAGPSSSRRRRSASSASGSSSTRCARSSRASAWWSSTTRSSAATPSARWSGCCARPAPREVHVRISSPPVKWPCFYGIDFATPRRADRQRHGRRGDRRLASAPTRSAYISLDGAGRGDHDRQADDLCRACFDGAYPMELPEPELLGKQLLEAELGRTRVDGLSALVGGGSGPSRPATGRRASSDVPDPMPDRVTGTHRWRRYAAAGVDIEAGDRAVELMKESVARRSAPRSSAASAASPASSTPRRSRRYRRPLLATVDRRRGHQGRHRPADGRARHHRASTWSAWSSTTWSSAAPSRCS